MERKIGYVMHKLTPIRLLKDLRLNVNLFRIMCMPLYRMGLLTSLCTTNTERNWFFKAVRRRFKEFCYLPRCLPNRVVEMILGDVEGMANEVAARAARHLQRDGHGFAVKVATGTSGYFKDVPSSLYSVLDLMYRSACNTHNRVLNRADLKLHGVRVDF